MDRRRESPCSNPLPPKSRRMCRGISRSQIERELHCVSMCQSLTGMVWIGKKLDKYQRVGYMVIQVALWIVLSSF